MCVAESGMPTVTTLLITLKEARKLLGKDAKQYTNEELEKLIVDLSAIAKLYIKANSRPRL